MIVYDSGGSSYSLFFHLYGSVLPETIPYGVVAAVLAIAACRSDLDWPMEHPIIYFGGFSFVMGFLLVYRTNISYQRFWQARTSIATLVSKYQDLMSHCKNFGLAYEPNKRYHYDLAHLLLLHFGVSIQRLRGEDDLYALMAQGVMTEDQRKLLHSYTERPFIVTSWITRHFVLFYKNGSEISVAPPVQAQSFRVIVELNFAYLSALQVKETPVPFPYVQCTFVFLHIWLICMPFVMVSFSSNHMGLAGLLSFIAGWAFFSIHRICCEMENPFGFEANDLSLDEYKLELRNALSTQLHAVPDSVLHGPSEGAFEEEQYRLDSAWWPTQTEQMSMLRPTARGRSNSTSRSFQSAGTSRAIPIIDPPKTTSISQLEGKNSYISMH